MKGILLATTLLISATAALAQTRNRLPYDTIPRRWEEALQRGNIGLRVSIGQGKKVVQLPMNRVARGMYANYVYRPFGLEKNFAIAQGVNAILMQGSSDYIEVFPALPASWRDVTFSKLKAHNGFVVSAVQENNVVAEVTFTATEDATLKFRRPRTLRTWIATGVAREKVDLSENNVFTIAMKKGQTVVLRNGYE